MSRILTPMTRNTPDMISAAPIYSYLPIDSPSSEAPRAVLTTGHTHKYMDAMLGQVLCVAQVFKQNARTPATSEAYAMHRYGAAGQSVTCTGSVNGIAVSIKQGAAMAKPHDVVMIGGQLMYL